jgi:hypothetical protein
MKPSPAADLAARYLQEVLEFDDRTSPDDWPEALLITGQELTDLLIRFYADARAAPGPPLPGPDLPVEGC